MKKGVFLLLLCLLLPGCSDFNSLVGSSNSFLASEANDNSMVVLNTNTKVYHDPKCKTAKNCSKNCVVTTKGEAKAKGATPCQKCGGGNKLF